MMPQPDPRKHGELRHDEVLWRADPLPPAPPAPGEDGRPQVFAWLLSGWSIGFWLVVSVGVLWARVQGWL